MNEHKHPSDHDLIKDVQSGDFEAFRIIVLRYSNALLSVAYSVVGDFHEAQDITQEAFVKCYHRLHTLQDPSRLGSWLYSIAYRTSLDFAKKKKSMHPIHESIVPQSDHIASWLDQHMLHESIWNALSMLEERSKTAIVLHYLSDWSMKKIGLFLDLSVSAVESRIRRAREVLRLNLADDYEHYFQSYRLDNHFEQKVSKQVLNRMGHFYIPVLNRSHTRLWFVDYFHLQLSKHGNLLLESGDELYLLECQTHLPSPIPLLTFSVTHIDQLWLSLKSKGVHIEPLETNELFGKLFPFYDPDGNKYYAAEKKVG
jgi:RNA polymerase sigma-70 factor (ECF subfamily)